MGMWTPRRRGGNLGFANRNRHFANDDRYMSISLHMHLALRELQLRLRSGRLWIAFVCTVALFCLAGPFGTGERLSSGELVAFWCLLHSACWSVGILGGAVVTALRPQVQLVERIAMTVAITALPIAAIVAAVRALFLDSPFTLAAVTAVLPVSAALTTILAINARATSTPLGDAGGLGPREAEPPAPPPAPAETRPADGAAPDIASPGAASPGADPAEAGPRILQRLSPERRGELRRLSMQDHYVEVATDRGVELILLRLGDAIAECAPVEGMQVHRSHWVARAAVLDAWRDGDRAMLALAGGERIPVSRGRVRALREAGWLPSAGLSAPEGSSR